MSDEYLTEAYLDGIIDCRYDLPFQSDHPDQAALDAYLDGFALEADRLLTELQVVRR